MNSRILIVDDDKRINDLLVDIFTVEGYETVSAYDGEEAIKILESNKDIPLMLLDVMLPEFDGWQVLDYVKQHFDVKVIMLTALSDEYNEAKGLKNGADDYVIKPFKRAALIERVKKLISGYITTNTRILVSGRLRVSQAEMKVYIDEKEIKITAKEYQLLTLLMKNRPNVLDRNTILEKIWGIEYSGNDRTIDTHIKMLRHSLGDCGELIRTVRGTGYSFEGEVTEI
ncbi:MAG: response regulator transcription factor [Acutalibacteraceae bacterium]|nr:response regulator transcription factor [Acutalibacteraceae bacterium]